MNIETITSTMINQEPIFGFSFKTILIVVIGLLILKGFALWKAAEKRSKGWFWALFLFNTLGVLDALYLFVFSKRK